MTNAEQELKPLAFWECTQCGGMVRATNSHWCMGHKRPSPNDITRPPQSPDTVTLTIEQLRRCMIEAAKVWHKTDGTFTKVVDGLILQAKQSSLGDVKEGK